MKNGKGKKKVVYKGKNIRISDSAYLVIKKYVDQHNYKIGGFIESAAIEKIKNDEKEPS